MSWNNVLFSIVVIILYVPLVFLGSNVFFPKYSDYPNTYNDCYISKPIPDINNETQRCLEDQNNKMQDFQNEKRNYDSRKYLAIIIFNFIIMLIIFFIKFNDSIIYGLFIGTVLSTFIATMVYFSTKSKLGFIALAMVFISAIYFITKLAKK